MSIEVLPILPSPTTTTFISMTLSSLSFSKELWFPPISIPFFSLLLLSLTPHLPVFQISPFQLFCFLRSSKTKQSSWPSFIQLLQRRDQVATDESHDSTDGTDLFLFNLGIEKKKLSQFFNFLFFFFIFSLF